MSKLPSDQEVGDTLARMFSETEYVLIYATSNRPRLYSNMLDDELAVCLEAMLHHTRKDMAEGTPRIPFNLSLNN